MVTLKPSMRGDRTSTGCRPKRRGWQILAVRTDWRRFTQRRSMSRVAKRACSGSAALEGRPRSAQMAVAIRVTAMTCLAFFIELADLIWPKGILASSWGENQGIGNILIAKGAYSSIVRISGTDDAC